MRLKELFNIFKKPARYTLRIECDEKCMEHIDNMLKYNDTDDVGLIVRKSLSVLDFITRLNQNNGYIPDGVENDGILDEVYDALSKYKERQFQKTIDEFNR